MLLSGSKMLLGLKQDPHYGIHCTCIEVHLHFSWQDNLLFCDACDKGFHMECLSPPMTETPTGKRFRLERKRIVMHAKFVDLADSCIKILL